MEEGKGKGKGRVLRFLRPQRAFLPNFHAAVIFFICTQIFLLTQLIEVAERLFIFWQCQEPHSIQRLFNLFTFNKILSKTVFFWDVVRLWISEFSTKIYSLWKYKLCSFDLSEQLVRYAVIEWKLTVQHGV